MKPSIGSIILGAIGSELKSSIEEYEVYSWLPSYEALYNQGWRIGNMPSSESYEVISVKAVSCVNGLLTVEASIQYRVVWYNPEGEMTVVSGNIKSFCTDFSLDNEMSAVITKAD